MFRLFAEKMTSTRAALFGIGVLGRVGGTVLHNDNLESRREIEQLRREFKNDVQETKMDILNLTMQLHEVNVSRLKQASNASKKDALPDPELDGMYRGERVMNSAELKHAQQTISEQRMVEEAELRRRHGLNRR